MKKALRLILFSFLLLLLIVITLGSYIQLTGIPKYPVAKIDYPSVISDSAMVANGEQIAMVQCIVCHRGSDNKLSGRLLQEIPPEFGEIHSTNITQSKEHGIGKWSDADIAYLLRTGLKPDGQYLPLYMPKFPHLSEYDLKSIIAYLRSEKGYVQASNLQSVKSQESFLVKFLCRVAFKPIAYPSSPIPEPDTTNKLAYGKYLVQGKYDCYTCHSKDFKKLNFPFPDKSEGYLGGGNTMLTLDKKERFTANITFDEETGLSRWTEQDFANAMLHSKSKNGKTIREPMLPYNNMTDLEIKSIWQYLISVPKIKNQVDRKWDEE